MATTSQSQHRCVFVGNIPYDATEEQLIQICKEVGPVVSFRLVIDRETGKPKGYGFCEYQDEETALSARRNLQGYDINGRQLRVDFAENDKNNDKSREQGRGGPGIVSTADPQKQLGVPAALRDPSFHHPLGDSVATAAATVMAGSLGLQNQILLGADPLTRHLAKISKSQLTEIMSEVKEMAMQDKEQARKLLLAIPNLPKALFQAQIMLGMVPPQMLLMPNILQTSVQPEQPILQNSQALPGLPPLPQNRLQYGISPYTQETQVSSGVSNPYATAPQFPAPSQIQRPQLVQNQVLSISSVKPQPVGGLSVRPQIHVPSSSSMNQPQQPSLPQHVGQVLPIHSISGYNGNVIGQNASTLTSALTRPQFPVDGFQPSSSTSSATSENMDLKGRDLSLTKKTRMANNSIDQINRAPKMVKLNDGRASASSQANLAAPISAAAPQTSHVSVRQTSIKEETPNAGAQVTQMQLPSDVDSALLEQVLNLTPEQLNSLPPDQQQQVIQLQQMLRQVA